MVTTINLLHSYSSKTFGLQHLYRDGNQHFGGVAFAANSTYRGYPICQRKIGFIDFNLPVEQLPIGTNHGTAQSVQHGPCGLIAPKSKHALQPQCADTMLLAGDVPNGGEPDAKLGAGLIKNGPRCCRRLMPACRTNQSAATESLNVRDHPTLRADQSVSPSQLLQIVPTCLFRVKPIKELNPGGWIILPSYRGSCWRVHLTILPPVELKGYPVHPYRYCLHNNSGRAARQQKLAARSWFGAFGVGAWLACAWTLVWLLLPAWGLLKVVCLALFAPVMAWRWQRSGRAAHALGAWLGWGLGGLLAALATLANPWPRWRLLEGLWPTGEPDLYAKHHAWSQLMEALTALSPMGGGSGSVVPLVLTRVDDAAWLLHVGTGFGWLAMGWLAMGWLASAVVLFWLLLTSWLATSPVGARLGLRWRRLCMGLGRWVIRSFPWARWHRWRTRVGGC